MIPNDPQWENKKSIPSQSSGKMWENPSNSRIFQASNLGESFTNLRCSIPGKIIAKGMLQKLPSMEMNKDLREGPEKQHGTALRKSQGPTVESNQNSEWKVILSHRKHVRNCGPPLPPCDKYADIW